MTKMYGHLIFPFSSDISDLLLKKEEVICYIVSREGNESSPQNISEGLRNFLVSKGFDVVSVKKTYLVGAKEICGQKVNVKKIIEDGEIRQLLVIVEGTDIVDVDNKIKVIQDFIKNKYNIISDDHTFTKTDRC